MKDVKIRSNEISEITKKEEILRQYREFVGRKLLFIFSCIVLTIIVASISATLGSYQISFPEVYSIIWNGLFKKPETPKELVVWNLRLPRILMGILAGAGLAIAGCTTQGILRNPLASPYTLGISAGASFGAALAILLGKGIVGGKYLIIVNAFLFSLIPTFVVVGISRFRRATPETMILTGIAMVYIFSAATTLLMYFSEAEAVKEAYFWIVGDLGKVSWDAIPLVFFILIACFLILLRKSWDINIMGAGDEVAKSLGVNVERDRILIMVIASFLTSSIVCFTGAIGFICLVAPHMARIVIGDDHRFLIPASGAVGGALLLTCDTIARRIIAPVILPVGVVTSFLGGPLFLYLILKKRKEYW